MAGLPHSIIIFLFGDCTVVSEPFCSYFQRQEAPAGSMGQYTENVITESGITLCNLLMLKTACTMIHKFAILTKIHCEDCLLRFIIIIMVMDYSTVFPQLNASLE